MVSKKKRFGLIVNPVAGMGGSVGLKGTDGGMHKEAIALGAQPVAPARTRSILSQILQWDRIRLLVAPAIMGGSYVDAALPTAVVEIGTIAEETSGKDLNERAILELLWRLPKRKIIVTPLGGNGFVFGRGNRQLSPEVIRRVGRENLVVIAAPGKLAGLRCLRVDTDDANLNQALSGYMDVVVGCKYSKVMPVEC